MSVIESESQATKLQPIADISVLHIEPSRSWPSVNLQELWAYRELLYFLVWRDVKVRYKQTVIGAAWAIFQPLMTMVVFTVVFRKFGDMPSDGLPYPLLSYAALRPWEYFARSFNSSFSCVVPNSHLLTKFYFPRLVLPLSTTLPGSLVLR